MREVAHEWRYHLGLEGVYKKKLALRGGLDNGKLRFGVGVGFDVYGKRTSLDYAYVATVEGLRADHVFAWNFSL